MLGQAAVLEQSGLIKLEPIINSTARLSNSLATFVYSEDPESPDLVDSLAEFNGILQALNSELNNGDLSPVGLKNTLKKANNLLSGLIDLTTATKNVIDGGKADQANIKEMLKELKKSSRSFRVSLTRLQKKTPNLNPLSKSTTRLIDELSNLSNRLNRLLEMMDEIPDEAINTLKVIQHTLYIIAGSIALFSFSYFIATINRVVISCGRYFRPSPAR